MSYKRTNYQLSNQPRRCEARHPSLNLRCVKNKNYHKVHQCQKEYDHWIWIDDNFAQVAKDIE